MRSSENILVDKPEDAITQLVLTARKHGRPDSYAGKRRWVRYSVGVRLEITTDPNRVGDTRVVRTHNVSGGGLGFWSKEPFSKGSTLFVREWSDGQPAAWVEAIVTYTSLGIGGYLIGVAFGEPAPAEHDYVSCPTAICAPTLKRPRPGVLCRYSLERLGILVCALLSAVIASVTAFIVPRLDLFADPTWGAIGWPMLAGLLGGFSGWVLFRPYARYLLILQNTVSNMIAGQPAEAPLAETPCHELAVLRKLVLDLGSKWRQHEDAEAIQRQRLEELTRIKSNILSIVSHDLRTPLTSILLYAKMAADELTELSREDLNHFLGIIADECTRLSRLVEDLLQVQRLESDRVEWKMDRQDISGPIRSCGRVFAAMAQSKSITLAVNCPESLPPINCDADKIAQVVSNLVSNALKYTPSGGEVVLFAEARQSEILICVSDNGPGIPRDKWDQIFERFAQLGDSNTRQIDGVGLGLYIVRQIIERHGGRVWLDSEVGSGSDFYIALPVEPETAAEPTSETDVSQGRVVFCDADPELAAAAAQVLRAQGYQVCVLHSAKRLLEYLSQNDVDIVITDLLLPDMISLDLLDALEDLRDRNFKLIGHSYGDLDGASRTHHLDAMLSRPVSRPELVETVEVVMAQRRSTTGRTLVFVAGGLDLEPLRAAAAARGHACLTASDVVAAGELSRRYAIDFILVPHDILLPGWGNLRLMEPHSRTRIMVVSANLSQAERRLAQTHEVDLRAYNADDDELLDALQGAPQLPVVESAK